VYRLHVTHALYCSDSCLSILSPYYHLLPSPCENQSMCAWVHVRVCGYVCVCVKACDRGVEIGTRQVSSWEGGVYLCTQPPSNGPCATWISLCVHFSNTLSFSPVCNMFIGTRQLSRPTSYFKTIEGGLPPSECGCKT